MDPDPNLAILIKTWWRQHGPTPVPLHVAKATVRHAQEHIDEHVLTAIDRTCDHAQQQGWITSTPQGWCLTDEGIRQAQKPEQRLSIPQANDLLDRTLDNIRAWNMIAAQHHCMGVAGVGLWGSLARHRLGRETLDSVGDIDLALVFTTTHQPISPPDQPPSLRARLGASALWASLPSQPTPDELENALLDWLGCDGVSLSGIDQWEHWGDHPSFAAQVLLLDPHLDPTRHEHHVLISHGSVPSPTEHATIKPSPPMRMS